MTESNHHQLKRDQLVKIGFWSLACLCIFGAPLVQPISAITLSPIVAMVATFVSLKNRSLAVRLLAALASFLAAPIYAVVVLYYLVPLNYESSLPLINYLTVAIPILIGSLASIAFWKFGEAESPKKHFIAHSTVFFVAPLTAGAFWMALYVYVFPYIRAAGKALVGDVWQTWIIVGFVIAGTLTSLWIWRLATRNAASSLRQSILVWILASSASALFWHTNTDEQIVEWQWASSVDAEVIDQLPESEEADQARILPRASAYNYILDSTNSAVPMIASQPHLVRLDRLVWQAHFHVDTVWGRPCNSIKQIVQTDADQTTKEPEVTDQIGFPHALFVCGSESWVMQSALKARHPFSTQGEHIYWRNKDGSWVAVVPLISRRPTLWGTMVPYLSGVETISQYGILRHYSVDEAVKRFPGVVLYPPRLASELGKLYGKWHGNFIGRGLTQVGELEISEDPAQSKDGSDHNHALNEMLQNRAPYLQSFKGFERLQEVIAFEPASKSNYGLIEVVLVDSGTGKWRVWKNSQNLKLSGPRNARDYIRQGDPDVGNWEHSLPVDPKLIHKKGRGIYYLWGVVTHDSPNAKDGNYVMSAFIDATTLRAWRVTTKEDIDYFLGLPKDPPPYGRPRLGFVDTGPDSSKSFVPPDNTRK